MALTLSDAERKSQNAKAMARVVCDTLDLIEAHVASIDRIAERYKGVEAFDEHMRSMGRADSINRLRKWGAGK